MEIFADNWILALSLSVFPSLLLSREREKIEMFLLAFSLSLLFATPAVKISVCFGNVNFARCRRRAARGGGGFGYGGEEATNYNRGGTRKLDTMEGSLYISV